jgi:DNA-binding MarR family transcriptional regulator
MPTYALSLLGREAHDQMAAALPDGLRLGHLAVLGALADEAPRTQRALAETLRIHPSDVVTIVDDLVARDLASRETDPEDRRRNLVRPTTAGRQLVRRATRDSRRISRELLAALSADERKTVEELLLRALS